MDDFTEEAPDATLAVVMTTVMMLISLLFREEAVLKLRMHLRRFMGLGLTSKQFMKERSIHAGNASTRQLQMEVLLNTSVQYMKERSVHAWNVTTRQLQKEVLLNTSVQFMKEINTHAGNERNIHAGNVTTSQLQREVLLNTSVQFIYKLIHVDFPDVTHAWDDEHQCQAHGIKKYQQLFVGQTDPC